MPIALNYPCLVLTRKGSGGVDYWSCELRFEENDTEQRDVDGSIERALEVCAAGWGLKDLKEDGDPNQLQEFKEGRKVYSFKWDDE